MCFVMQAILVAMLILFLGAIGILLFYTIGEMFIMNKKFKKKLNIKSNDYERTWKDRRKLVGTGFALTVATFLTLFIVGSIFIGIGRVTGITKNSLTLVEKAYLEDELNNFKPEPTEEVEEKTQWGE